MYEDKFSDVENVYNSQMNKISSPLMTGECCQLVIHTITINVILHNQCGNQ